MDKLYLVFVNNDIDPEIIGPFWTGECRDARAKKLRADYGDSNGIYMLSIDSVSGLPAIYSYSGNFFSEED